MLLFTCLAPERLPPPCFDAKIHSTVALLGNLLGSWIIDRVGRKAILLFSHSGCLLCVVLEIILVALFADSSNAAAKSAGVALLYIFLLFYAVGIDVGTYVYLGEMFPNHIRVKGVGAALATLNMTATVYLSVAGTAFATIGWKFLLVGFPSLSSPIGAAGLTGYFI